MTPAALNPAALTPTPIIDDQLIRELSPGLFRYARQRISSDDIAHDVVQDTWVAAIKGLDRFAGRASLRTWLVSILRRKVVDVHRRRKPSVSFEEYHSPLEESPRERLDDLAALKVVHAEIDRLPRREQQAVTLVDVEGLSREEAAERMGVTRAALRVMLHRGRTKLREKLEAEEHALH